MQDAGSVFCVILLHLEVILTDTNNLPDASVTGVHFSSSYSWDVQDGGNELETVIGYHTKRLPDSVFAPDLAKFLIRVSGQEQKFFEDIKP